MRNRLSPSSTDGTRVTEGDQLQSWARRACESEGKTQPGGWEPPHPGAAADCEPLRNAGTYTAVDREGPLVLTADGQPVRMEGGWT